MSANIKLIQIVISVDGQLCFVPIPDESKQLLIGMLPAFFPDSKIAAVKMPDNMKMVPLSELEGE